RPKVPNFTPEEDSTFQIGKIQILRSGKDVSIFACGHLVWNSLLAAEEMSQEQGIECQVINVHTIKPLDEESILQAVSETRHIVTAEEHMRNGGLGDSIAQLLARRLPLPIEMVAVDDSFGESGDPPALMAKYGLDVKAIKAAIARVLTR
ncbi:MAG: transketolase family protein, partial [Bacteroidia bacterium]|nr:transketolase family protein [Bacteroidia bacterium]